MNSLLYHMPFEMLELRFQRPTDCKECYISLYDKHLVYHVDFLADEPTEGDDWEMGITNRINYFDVVALKSFIAGVEMSYTMDKKWKVMISANGIAYDLRVYFKSQTKAEAMYTKINKWLLND